MLATMRRVWGLCQTRTGVPTGCDAHSITLMYIHTRAIGTSAAERRSIAREHTSLKRRWRQPWHTQ